eukprot:CAMPEP_0115846164 /NCGR_PEP_ID=MMETSP0287-20121206/9722_1 /TAXON_ID=412157 /ORGANISM="Chrysochromulina rotalis, Strain UIO044" /LENGTH=362 /DNA_ID=CAMNT_0003299951 /DNA_START=36 /DNA_END=1124 /DNA_ORIENTATION=+
MPPRCTINATPPPPDRNAGPQLPPQPPSERRGGVVLEFDGFGGGSKAPSAKLAPASKHERPWRKSASAIKEERAKSAAILGGKGGVDQGALRLAIAAQELIDAGRCIGNEHVAAAQSATTTLLQVATNDRPVKEVDAARCTLEAAFGTVGLADSLAQLAGGDPIVEGRNRLQLLHEVIPRLWVGGWAALNNDCEALRTRKVTHVLSVLSADQRRLPTFILGHHYVRVDDSEEAAEVLASHFEEIAEFIDKARSAGGVVFVHCGAGISRAPTSAVAYLIWKLRMRAVDAIALVRSKRHNVRPNPGFVAQLKKWEQKVLAEPAASPARHATSVPTVDNVGSGALSECGPERVAAAMLAAPAQAP